MSPQVLTREEIKELRAILAERLAAASPAAAESGDYPIHLTNKKGKAVTAEDAEEVAVLRDSGFMLPEEYREFLGKKKKKTEDDE